jgi:hypothetical protein
MIFSTFVCEDIDDGQSYLRADYAINCASPEHQTATAFAALMIFVYPLGAPALYAYIFFRKRTLLAMQRQRQLLVIAKREVRMQRAVARALGSTLGPRLKQGRAVMELIEPDRRHAPRTVHLVVHPGCVAWYSDAEAYLPMGWAWPRACTLSANGRAAALLVRALSEERLSHACGVELRLTQWRSRKESMWKSGEVRMGEDVAAWQRAIEPQLGACREHLVARGWQRLSECKLEDGWTRLLRHADAMPRVLFLTEHHEKAGGEPGGFVTELTLARLPGYFKKLIGPYELRVHWFEVFECVRKVALVGLPVFFMPGSLEQLILGLFIAFLSFGVFMLLGPFLELKHDYVSRLCQLQIFFALLAGVVLKGDPGEGRVEELGVLLVFICGIPPLAIAFLVSPWGKYAIDERERDKVRNMLKSGWKAARRCCRACCGCAGAAPARVVPNATVSTTSGRASGTGTVDGNPIVCPSCSGFRGRDAGAPPACTEPACPGCTFDPSAPFARRLPGRSFAAEDMVEIDMADASGAGSKKDGGESTGVPGAMSLRESSEALP